MCKGSEYTNSQELLRGRNRGRGSVTCPSCSPPLSSSPQQLPKCTWGHFEGIHGERVGLESQAGWSMRGSPRGLRQHGEEGGGQICVQACPPWTSSVTGENRTSGLSARPASVSPSSGKSRRATTHSHLVHVIWAVST